MKALLVSTTLPRKYREGSLRDIQDATTRTRIPLLAFRVGSHGGFNGCWCGGLPGVPSHEVLNRNGLDLKAFSLILLEKIEELTLYLIQQQSQIESLEAALKQNTNLAVDKTTADQEKNPMKKNQN